MRTQGIPTTLVTDLHPIETPHARALFDWSSIPRKASRWVHAPLLQIRPRISLLTGSALVLLSLYIPVAFNACGINRTGREFLRADGLWPGMASLVGMGIERGVYALAVTLAALTLLILLATLRHPKLMEKEWIKWPFLSAGVICLFAVADFVWFNVSALLAHLLEGQFWLDQPEVMIPLVDGLAILVMALCLRSQFLRSQRWIVWLFGVESIICLLAIAAVFLEQFEVGPFLSSETVFRMSASPGILYWVVPTVLWIQLGFSRSEARNATWQRLRPRIMMLYFPAGVIAGALFFWPDARAVWGLAPYLAGLSLIFLGYTELAHRLPSTSLSKTSV
jgi:hypothetical protein